MTTMRKRTLLANLMMRTMRDWSLYKKMCYTVCNKKAGIPSSWMLLDSQSTMDIFCNTKMLTSISDAKIHLALHCNAGTASVTKKGDLKM